MTLEELAREAIATLNDSPIPDPKLVLKWPGKWGSSNKRRLAGPNSPQGVIVREEKDGIVVLFEAIDVLAYCVSKGVEVHIIERTKDDIS